MYDQDKADLLRENQQLRDELAEVRAALIEAEPKADETVYTEPDYARVPTVEIVRTLAAKRDGAVRNWGDCHEWHVVAEGHNMVLRERLRHSITLPVDAVHQIDTLVLNAYTDVDTLVHTKERTEALLASWRLVDPPAEVPGCPAATGEQPPPRGVLHKATMLPLSKNDDRVIYRACPADPAWTYLEAVRNTPLGNHYHRTHTQTYALVWGSGLYVWSDVDTPNAPVYARQIVPGDFITIPPGRAYAFVLDPGSEMVGHHDGPHTRIPDEDTVDHRLYPPPPGNRTVSWAGSKDQVSWQYLDETDPLPPGAREAGAGPA